MARRPEKGIRLPREFSEYWLLINRMLIQKEIIVSVFRAKYAPKIMCA
jgi:hypothetical protein